MTKTLTEQWCEGTLKSGNYYTVCYKGWSGETFPCNLYYSERIGFDANVKEVLAPVPSYEKWKEISESEDQAHAHLQDEREKNMCLEESVRVLSKQLAIATKALKEMVGYPPKNFPDCETYMWAAQQALKEMEGVK